MPKQFTYAINQASKLLCYQHLGMADGSFNWQGPNEVGTGWGDFKHVFSGGDDIIYAVEPVADAILHLDGTRTPAKEGNLLWYRHVGQEDGSFKWEGPKKVGTGWAGFKHVFSGGDDIIYAVEPVADAILHLDGTRTPAKEGNLLWYRHVGQEDGSFKWEGPKKVGTGWAGFKHVFSGGDGIIYAVEPVADAILHVDGTRTPAKEGNLLWYRHVGQEDGSFRWEGPKKIGTGWTGFKEVFAGSDGIIYAVEPVADAILHVDGTRTPAKEGNLLWYRHIGQEDGSFRWDGPKKVGTGWAGFKEVFSNGFGFSSDEELIRRCGTPDPNHNDIHIQTYGSPPYGRWLTNILTYNVNANNSGRKQDDVEHIVADAFGQWMTACSRLSFSLVDGPADIQILFGDHNFDERFGKLDGTLAFGGHPNTNDQGHLYFDSSENWKEPNLLLAVALHEIGHVLGLPHSNVRTSIMYPYNMSLINIDAETVRAIQSLYGWHTQVPINDKGSSEGPSLAIAGRYNFGFDVSYTLYMAWRGIDDDDNLYWSFLNGDQWSPQQNIPGTGSAHGPVLATGYTKNGSDGLPVTGLFMAWDGVPGDNAIYYSQNNNLNHWGDQRPVDLGGTSDRPALCMFDGNMRMAWKGVEGDNTLWWTTFDGNDWSTPAPITGRGSSYGPTMATLGNRLYMFWRGIGDDSKVYYAWIDNGDNQIWQPQHEVVYTVVKKEGNENLNIGTSSRPVAVTRNNTIILAWKGVENDSSVWFSYFENDEFSGQINILQAGSSSGPGLGVLDQQLYAVWKGIAGDTGLYFSWLG